MANISLMQRAQSSGNKITLLSNKSNLKFDTQLSADKIDKLIKSRQCSMNITLNDPALSKIRHLNQSFQSNIGSPDRSNRVENRKKYLLETGQSHQVFL